MRKLKKVTSLVLAFIIIVSAMTIMPFTASAASTSEYTDKIGVPLYQANIIANGYNNDGEGYYKLFKSLQDPLYYELTDYMLQDGVLCWTSNFWNAAFNSEFQKNPSYFYEVMLMGFLKYDQNQINTSGVWNSKEMALSTSIYNTLASNYIDKFENPSYKDFLKQVNELSNDEVKNILSNIDDIKITQQALDTLSKGCSYATEFVQAVTDYQALLDAKSERIELLKLAKAKVTDNEYFTKAVDDIIDKMEQTPIEYVSGQMLDKIWDDFLDSAWDLIIKDSPIAAVLKAIDIEKMTLDVLFNTSETASDNFKLLVLYIVDTYFSSALDQSYNNYKSSATVGNAATLVQCYTAYIEYQEYGLDYTKTFISNIVDGGSIHHIIEQIFFQENIKNAAELIQHCNNQINNREKMLELLDKSADVYYSSTGLDDLVDAIESTDEDVNIPVTGISFKQSEITLNSTEDICLIYADVYPENASNKKVTYTSSDPSILSVPSDGGFATQNGKGTVTITATTEDGGFTATQKINVNYTPALIADAHGKCGDSAYWTLYSNGVLNITGTGEIYDYSPSTVPWRYFKNGIKITKVNISNGITRIGECAFMDCIYLTSISIPDNVLSIGYAAFFGCTNLSDVKIGVNVRKIEGYSFKNCINLKCITISDSIESCGQYSFENCNIEKIIFADGTETINNNMIVCNTVESIVVPDSVTKIKGGILDNTDWYKQQNEGLIYAGRILYKYKGEMPDNTSIVLKDGTVEIADSAFSGCEALKKILLPNSLKEIGNYAFSRCVNLTNITIPSGVNRIGQNAFYQSGLVEIYIPGNVKILDNCAFYYCESLSSIYVEKGVEFIGADVFSRTPWFENQKEEFVIINNNLIKYNWPYYDNATHVYMKKIEFPEGIKKICGGSITYPAYVSEVVLPQSLSVIGSESFSGCWSLTTVKMPNNVEIIENSAFYDCKSLSKINLLDKITNIGNYAFFGCIELKRILIPANVENIGTYAFGRTWNGNKIDDLAILGYSGTEAERYAIACNIPFVDLDKTKTDSNTGVSVVTELNFDLSVIQLTDTQSITTANKALGTKVTLSNLYDISLMKDGEPVQPDGTATVKIPCENKNAKIYRIEDNGTATDMNAVYDNGYMVFSTEHFSLYALVVPNDNVFGDVNGDGVVNAKDRMLLTRYLAKWSGYEDIDIVSADVNKDGTVNAKDRMILTRYLAKWQGYETLPYTDI